MSAQEKREIHELLKRVGIEEKIFVRVDHLSGGQQQRVALARALYQKPQAILADEPVSAVDPERARDLVALLTSLAKEEGITLIMSLHDVALARQFFDRVVGLREGRVVFDGRADEAGVKNLYRLEKSLPEMP
jgi:phosphonate transport system ATP-binding protein